MSIPSPPPLPCKDLYQETLHICPGIRNFVASTIEVKTVPMCFDHFCPYCNVGYSFCTKCKLKIDAYSPMKTYPMNNVQCLFCGNWCAKKRLVSYPETFRRHQFLQQDGCDN